jgi:predicted PurR-regulated permease PerM
MQFTSTQKRVASWAGIVLLCGLLLWLLAPALTPFVVAAVLAYALQPLVRRIDAWWGGRLPRVLAVLGVELLFLIAALGLVLLVVPILSKELPLMREQLPLLLDRLGEGLRPLLAQYGLRLNLDLASLKALLLKYLNTNSEDLFASLLSSLKLGGSVALAVVGNAVLIPVALFYLLLDWDRFVARAVELVPLPLRDAYDRFMAEADAVLGQYLRGQLLVMGILAVFYTVALALCGLKLALPIGVFTGLAVFVPYLGFGLGLVLALLAALLQFQSLTAVALVGAVYAIGQVVESMYLTPRLLGERIGLHPIAVIFALLAFGHLLGFVGVLIALPASAVLLVALRRLQTLYVDSDLYRDAQ